MEEDAAGLLLLLRRETSPRGVAAKDSPPDPGRSGAPPSTRYLSPLGIHAPVILWPFVSTSEKYWYGFPRGDESHGSWMCATAPDRGYALVRSHSACALCRRCLFSRALVG